MDEGDYRHAMLNMVSKRNVLAPKNTSSCLWMIHDNLQNGSIEYKVILPSNFGNYRLPKGEAIV